MSGIDVAKARFDRLDALRGVAIVWMAIFHFCFDLNHFGFIEPKHRFTVDVFWTAQRIEPVEARLRDVDAAHSCSGGDSNGTPESAPSQTLIHI